MDVDALHALILDTGNAESSVTVNQRALIDKVLSRYSSENTLLRELLQNSDDANATAVKIVYESSNRIESESKTQQGDFSKRLTKRVTVRNNGQTFRPEDWSRLSRIAEGNPDEAKIGAFGVGFYSVFSVCDDPFVTSGNIGLAFYWRNDQLFTRSATLPTSDTWTSFSLNMRQEIELPNLKTLTKFLATSLTFSRSVAAIELWLDDLELCNIKRIASPSSKIAIPASLSTTTTGKVFKITGLESSSVQISATYLNATQATNASAYPVSKLFSFFSSKSDIVIADPLERTTSTIFLRILTGAMTSNLNSAHSAELQRATKKPPPRNTKIQLVVVNAAEYAASTAQASIFENLLTFPNQGRVFIGFPTHQTTGFAGHVGAPCAIPTVERESIDLVDRFIKIWNFEVLRAIGLLTRIAYHMEFQNILTVQDAIHTMKFFSMRQATPQAINQSIEPVFFESASSLPVFSSRGVQSTEMTRLADPRVRFLKSIPILPEDIEQQVPDFIRRLKQLGYIDSISIKDIKKDLQDRTLDIDEGVLFLQYCASISAEVDETALTSLLQAGIIVGTTSTSPVNVGHLKFFADPRVIPNDAPLPFTCAFPEISSRLSTEEKRALRWQEISLLEWLMFIVADATERRMFGKDITKDPEFASIVLAAVSKGFDGMRPEERVQTITVLKDKTCIPTKNHGMKRPEQAYFHIIKSFEDLPLILTMKGVKEKFLVALGVRRTIELDIIFDQLLGNSKWSAHDVISYLASARKVIPPKDLERLKTVPFARAEETEKKYMISELYEPIETLRTLRLPIILWPKGKWNSQPEETKFLYTLGLQTFPQSSVLIKLAADASDPKLREQALSYFILNFAIHNYAASYNSLKVRRAFIPTESGGLELPTNVYADSRASQFGFEVLRRDLIVRANILGVSVSPPVGSLVNLLFTKPPQSHEIAMAQFEFIAFLQPQISKSDLDQISTHEFIPIESNGNFVKFSSPGKCFFKSVSVDQLYTEIFDFVDFGQQGNQFLRAVGVRDEPSTAQIAAMLVSDATTVWNICGSEDRYTSLLSQIAKDIAKLRNDRVLFGNMMKAKFLLCHKYIESKESGPVTNDITEDPIDNPIHGMKQSFLEQASQVLVVDDVLDFDLFKNAICTCPQNTVLEELYIELGSVMISSMTLDRPITSGRQVSNELTNQLKIDLLERLSIMLSDQSIRRKSNTRDLISKLQVIMQEKVSLQRTLRFGSIVVSKDVRTTALILSDGPTNSLVVNQKPDIYDVAVAVCRLVLYSPRPGTYLLLESMLTNSLQTLKARGYNVHRILQKQEQDQRERQSRLDAENRLAAAETKAAQSKIDEDRKRAADNEKDKMTPELPGRLPDGPVVPVASSVDEPLSGLFRKLKRGWGNKQSDKKCQDLIEERRPTPEEQSVMPDIDQESALGSSVMPGIQVKPSPIPTELSPAALNRDLRQAIRSTRSSDDRSIFSPQRTETVQEAKSYCDITPAQNLVLVATLENSFKFFVNRSLTKGLIVKSQLPSANRFSELLADLGNLFGVTKGALNIYYNQSGPTIAFNLDGTIYCNLHYFTTLHDMESRTMPSRESSAVATNRQRRCDALTFWFTTLAHELAHNLIKEHSSAHGFYTESLVIAYLPNLVALFSSLSGRMTGTSEHLPDYSVS